MRRTVLIVRGVDEDESGYCVQAHMLVEGAVEESIPEVVEHVIQEFVQETGRRPAIVGVATLPYNRHQDEDDEGGGYLPDQTQFLR